jgi:chromate transporter
MLRTLFTLYISFLKIGGLTFGGGHAMIPIIQRVAVDEKSWATNEEMTDYITIGQSIPGVVAINMATAVGRKVAGVRGAIAATLGMATPSFIMMILIAAVFDDLLKYAYVEKAFMGVRAAVAALILTAALKLAKNAVKNILQLIFALSSFAFILFLNVPQQYLIIICGVLYVIYGAVFGRRKDADSP